MILHLAKFCDHLQNLVRDGGSTLCKERLCFTCWSLRRFDDEFVGESVLNGLEDARISFHTSATATIVK